MKEDANLKNSKNSNGNEKVVGGVFEELITLIRPNEKLVKKETKSLVVRTKESKLVRRTAKTDLLLDVYNLINEGETFVREEENRVIVRNETGKLVARKKQALKQEQPSKTTTPIKKELKPEPKQETKNEEVPDKKDLKERLMARHAFLGRMERGEKIGVAPSTTPSKNAQIINSDLVEEIEDNEDVEDIAPDNEVTQLEKAVTDEKYNREIGKGSSVGRRTNQTVGYVAGGAKNPNEKPSLRGSATGNGLMGNYSLATPEKESIPEPEKKKKAKKQRKPIKPWVIVVALVSLYVIGMATYFFTSFNFNKKEVNIVLYYIDVGQKAKLEYYDGEKFNFNDMKMTYYYGDDKVETFNISESEFGETTIGMGYGLNNGYISALWNDGYSNLGKRDVKVKFVFDDLICYVPVSIYRNKLVGLDVNFKINSLSAGKELYPTVFGKYSNQLLEDRNETITRELSLSSYHIMLLYQGAQYSLKDIGSFDGTKYVMPETIDNMPIDYSGVKLIVRVEADGFSSKQEKEIYPN